MEGLHSTRLQMARRDSDVSYNCSLYTRYSSRYEIAHIFHIAQSSFLAVDGQVSEYFSYVMELSGSMLLKLCAVVIMSPLFLAPGVIVFLFGGWCGQIYMKAQLSVKREMSNARSPVLGHFSAAIAGLSKRTRCHPSELILTYVCSVD